MRQKKSNIVALCVEITLTLVIVSIISFYAVNTVGQEASQYQSGLEQDYKALIDSYIRDFKLMADEVIVKINEDVSYDELQRYLLSKESAFETAIGSDIYDGFSLTYKGQYAHSWDYGDYSDYDPDTRPWYQTAQRANGQIAVTAPYKTFLEEELLDGDEYVVLTITQRYNDDVSFCFDIKTYGVNDLLSNRYGRYADTFAMMYDETGYILSSTQDGYYCHNVYEADQTITPELMKAINTLENSAGKAALVTLLGKVRLAYLSRDEMNNCYLMAIPLFDVVKENFLGVFLLTIILIFIEIWIFIHTQKQIKAELEVEKVKNVAQMKQDFLARMSHDMRTPMNGILGISELSMDETDVSVLQENFQKVYSSGQYLLGLINDSLDLQKLESGKMVLHPQIIDTDRLIATSLDMFYISAKNKNITFQVENKNADLKGYVKTDPMRVRQIFVNLLNNAIKYTPQGGTVTFSVEVLGREKNIVHDRLTVADTGVGMSREFLDKHLFNPFAQEHNRLSDTEGGSGLGLAIVKNLVDTMGGKITVESEVGKGTRISVDLDFECVEPELGMKLEQQQDNQEQREPTAASQAAASKEEAVDFSGKRILLAEDHPLNAEIAKKLLERKNAMICWVKNGQECVDCFAHAKPGYFDMILMDIRMPIMDGLEAARQIRLLSRPDAQTIPIVAMSANAYEEDVEKSLQAGMNGHLSKPINTKLLYETVEKFT